MNVGYNHTPLLCILYRKFLLYLLCVIGMVCDRDGV